MLIVSLKYTIYDFISIVVIRVNSWITDGFLVIFLMTNIYFK